MALKLKSVLENQQLTLLFKALMFGAFLLFTPPLLFIIAALFLYFKPLFNTFSFFSSFIILLILSLSLTNGLLAAILFSFVFYIILGVKNLVFINRWRWYHLLHLSLFYSTFLLFFLSDNTSNFFFKSFGLFLISVFLLREFLKFAAADFPKRRLLISWALSLFVVEITWVIGLLPLGFLNSANLALLSVFALGDLTLHHFRGTLGRKVVLSTAALFVLLTLLIFATSQWSIWNRTAEFSYSVSVAASSIFWIRVSALCDEYQSRLALEGVLFLIRHQILCP